MARVKYLDGLEAAQRVFARLPVAVVAEITHALNLGAKEMAEAAKLLAPEDTGDMKDNIKANPVKESARKSGGLVATVTVGDNPGDAEAAYRSEFGRAPGGDNQATHPGHEAQSFMAPAYYAKRRRVRSRVKRAVKKAAMSVARRK